VNECEVCGFPLVWSIDQVQVWCSVYGLHRRTPTQLVIDACELSQTSGALWHRRQRHLEVVA
jgi:hypothetical protein